MRVRCVPRRNDLPAYLMALLSLLLFTLCCAIPAQAEAPAQPSLETFIRYTKDPGQLSTSVVRFQNSSGQLLDLYSAVHVGSGGYYKMLNERFKDYDAVLYELILPDEMAGQRLPSQMGSDSGVSGLQGMLARSLGLTTQIDRIDYSAANFVHADLTQSGLSQKMAERQENLMAYMMKAMMSSNQIDDQDLGITDQELAQLDLMAVISGKGTTQDRKVLRKLFASVLSSSGSLLSALGDTALIAERNKAALQVVKQQAEGGARKMALFYGAAHMPDMERRLEEMGWSRVKTDWLKAWSI